MEANLLLQFLLDCEAFVLKHNQDINKEQVHIALVQILVALYKENPENIPSELHGLFEDFLQKIESIEIPEDTSTPPVVKAIAHRAKSVLVERSNIGRKLQDENALSALYQHDDREILTAHIGKKKLNDVVTVASLSFETIEEWKQFLPENKRITPFMLEIATHLMTIKAAGNDWTSSKILFRQMNGGADKTPTKEFCESLYQALSVLACTRIKIDARKEVKAGNNDKEFYQGALLANSIRGREIVTINGSVIDDAIHILEQSPLFEYARIKGQITPIPSGMYDTPSVNSTQENIVIKGYLIRLFADMINIHSPVKPIIRYDSLYEYLGVDESKKAQIRTIKARIRKTVRGILSDWVNGRFIKGFQELTEDNNPVKERIPAAKVILDLLTKKEFNAIHNSVNILPAK